MKPVSSQPDVEKHSQELLDKVSQFGRVVAANVDHFQPDLVVGLAHSGWLPVLAAQAVWEVAQKRPFFPNRISVPFPPNHISLCSKPEKDCPYTLAIRAVDIQLPA